MNQMHALVLYRHQGAWVYDDPVHGREAEPFVLGASEMLDTLLTLDLPHRLTEAGLDRSPFRVLFSAEAFPDAHRAERLREEAAGNWYRFGDQEGWLCPALFDYFDHAPAELWVTAEETSSAEQTHPQA